LHLLLKAHASLFKTRAEGALVRLSGRQGHNTAAQEEQERRANSFRAPANWKLPGNGAIPRP